MQKAEELGVQQSFFFKTVMHNYQVQLGIINELEPKAKSGDSKALTDYNKTITSANTTAKTLMQILNSEGEQPRRGVKLIEDKQGGS